VSNSAPEGLRTTPASSHWLGKTVILILVMPLVLLAFLVVTPSELLQALPIPVVKPPLQQLTGIACAVVFITTLTLWVLDSAGILQFKHTWMSKAIWGIGISSILATTVLLYKSGTSGDAPFAGVWRARINYPVFQGMSAVQEQVVLVTYNSSATAYVAQSDVVLGRWITISNFKPTSDAAVIEFGQELGSQSESMMFRLTEGGNKLLFGEVGVDNARITMIRQGTF
jgi:hypothetical protein